MKPEKGGCSRITGMLSIPLKTSQPKERWQT